jgi:hypothetical protein
MYVDDLIGVSAREDWERDRDGAVHFMTTLLGPHAEEPDKRDSTEKGRTRTITVLGWQIDLSDWSIGISAENRRKALYVFWRIDGAQPINVHQWEAVCSLASRYAKVYRELRVLLGDLWRALGAWNGRAGHILRLPEEAVDALHVWRAYLVASEISPTAHARPLRSFEDRSVAWTVEFDGSLEGVGVRVFRVSGDGKEVECARHAVMRGGKLPASDFQNSMELSAAACGLAATVMLGASGHAIRFRGDSVVALQWIRGESTGSKSERARGAAMVIVALCEKHDLVIDASVEHILSKENAVCDALSRGRGTRGGHWRSPSPAAVDALQGVLDICDPLWHAADADGFLHRWEQVRRVVSVVPGW